MKTITLNPDKNLLHTTRVCSSCHYTYETETQIEPYKVTLCLGGSNNGAKPFIKLLDKHLFTDDYGDLQAAHLYVCPRCLTVQLDESEIDD